jgi:cell division protein FtsX
LVLTFSARRWLAVVGISLLAHYGVGFAFGELTELFQHNVGISACRWDVVIAGSVIGAIIGIAEAVLGVQTLVRMRRADRPVATPVS